MPSTARRTASKPVTIAEYDAFVDAQDDDTKYELVNGVIVMMTTPTQAHGLIAANIAAPLNFAMDRRGCMTFIGGMAVQRSDDPTDTEKTIPDIVVRRGTMEKRSSLTDPLVVVEILSPSTMDLDRGWKLDFYKSLPTLRHIVLVYQDEMRAEHYRRTEQKWDIAVLKAADDLLHFDAVDFRLDLGSVYRSVVF
ncbi:MAG: Uma2 family endonuclease [Hyphomicrobiaceae bacterium]